MRMARSSGLRRTFVALLAGVLLAQHASAARASDTESAGDVLRAALPAAAFALTVRRDDREGRRQFYKSFGATVVGTLALKETFDKKRPDGTGDDAFPSGHAATAFQGAAFIHRRYGIRDAWPAYVLATFTAWTRVDADEHDNADVLAGAAIGIASSFVLAKRRNVEVTALAEPDTRTYGLKITGRF
jgi:membrane-associated phospholipid phosphatase